MSSRKVVTESLKTMLISHPSKNHYGGKIMQLSLEDITKLRASVIEYAGNFDKEGQKEQKMGELLGFMEKSTGLPVHEDMLPEILFYETHKQKEVEHVNFKKHPVMLMEQYICEEEESLERIGRLIGRPVHEMTNEEMTDTAMRLFMLPWEDYKQLAESKGLELETWGSGGHTGIEHRNDSLMLIGLLQARGEKIGRDEMKKMVLDMPKPELGYFASMFNAVVRDMTKEHSMFGRDVFGLHNVVSTEWVKQKDELEGHQAYDKKLREQHSIAPPELLPEKTINLDIIPYAIAFTQDGHLAILGNKRSEDRGDDCADSEMVLYLHDRARGKLMQHTNTGIHSLFDGTIVGADSFLGSLSVGSDGLLYVSGDRRFSSSLLECMEDKDHSNFLKAIDLLKRKELLGYERRTYKSMHASQVVESEGIFYFNISPMEFPRNSDNIIVATDSDKIIGTPIVGYGVTDGSHGSNFDPSPRIAVHGNDIYFKAQGMILAVDRSMSEDSVKNPSLMVGGEEYIWGAIPSNHCVSPEGVLYAVTQEKEEKVQSIKGYIKGKEAGEFVTHVYPEDHPGGWATFRSMAISDDGILAYTSLQDNKVHFYKLDEFKLDKS
jgi:hypothetical protein